MKPKQLAAAAAWLAEQKKGLDIQVIDVSQRLRVVDYFVVVSGQSRPHVRALEDEIHGRLRILGERHQPVEGAQLGWWVLLDYSDVVVHIMQPEARGYYDLERLYGDCPRLDWTKVPLPELPELPDARALA